MEWWEGAYITTNTNLHSHQNITSVQLNLQIVPKEQFIGTDGTKTNTIYKIITL